MVEVIYHDDKKEKLSSHEARINVDLDHPLVVGYGNLSITSYGSTKEEAFEGLMLNLKEVSKIILQFEDSNDIEDDGNEEW